MTARPGWPGRLLTWGGRLPGWASRPGRLLRWPGRLLGWAPNPFRRRVDRVEAMIRTALAALFLVAAPILAAGAARHAAAAAHQLRAAERGWKLVTATYLQRPVLTAVPYAGLAAGWALARWTAPGGQPRTGLVGASSAGYAGQRVRIWVDRAGRPTAPPLAGGAVSSQVGLAATLVPLGLAAGVVLTGLAVRSVAGRRRLASWGREWDAVEPRWSGLRF